MTSTPSPNLLDKLAFAALVLILYTVFDYWEILFWPPQGIHFMRQTDSLSFIAFYMHTGNGLFEPGTLSLFSKNGHTASEFPLIYYLMQFVWKAFGRQEFLLRLFHVTATTVGLWHLFLLGKHYLKNTITVLPVILFAFSSSVWIYYANNFLPDASALGFTLSGLYFFHCYFTDAKHRHALYTALFFAAAGLMKVSYFIYPMACLLYLTWIKRTELKPHLRIYFYMGMAALSVVSWTVYVSYYNKLNHGYFLSQAKPLWQLSQSQIDDVIYFTTDYWFTWYYDIGQMYVWAGVLLLLLVFSVTRFNQMLLPILMLAGSVCYIVLFFYQFRNHDYYILAMFPSLFVSMYAVMQQINQRIGFAVYLAAASLVGYIGYQGTLFADNYTFWRYWNAREHDIDPFAYVGTVLRDMHVVLDDAGIDRNARFVYIKDPGVNGAPYYCNRFGWNVWDTVPKYLRHIPDYIKGGAEFILLTDTSYARHTQLAPFLNQRVVQHGMVSVYTIRQDSLQWPVFLIED